MQLPIQVTIRDIPQSTAIESHILKKASKLDKYYDRIQSCRVIIDLPQKHKHQGKLFRVRIDLTVPGKELVVNHKLDEDVYVAIRDAFHAVIRQLEHYAQRRRGTVKTHELPLHGVVKRIYLDDGYGFIRGVDGTEYYFGHSNVAFPGFDRLHIGDGVQFLAEPTSEGCQARRVTREKRNHFEKVA